MTTTEADALLQTAWREVNARGVALHDAARHVQQSNDGVGDSPVFACADAASAAHDLATAYDRMKIAVLRLQDARAKEKREATSTAAGRPEASTAGG